MNTPAILSMKRKLSPRSNMPGRNMPTLSKPNSDALSSICKNGEHKLTIRGHLIGRVCSVYSAFHRQNHKKHPRSFRKMTTFATKWHHKVRIYTGKKKPDLLKKGSRG